MFDDLEALLKTAKHQAFLERLSRKAKIPKSPPVVIKRQANYEWTVGKTVCLIHKAADGTETALGLFIEHLRNGSRWLRPTADTLSADHSEIVTGSWWIHPMIREIPVDSAGEVVAIRARFEALLREFGLEGDPEEDEDWDIEDEEDDE